MARKRSTVEKRLEYLRKELRAERISYGELAELQDLVKYIDPGDMELLEAAGVEEFPELPTRIQAREKKNDMARKRSTGRRKSTGRPKIKLIRGRHPAWWGGEDPEFTLAKWKHDVVNTDMRLGYWEWLQHEIKNRRR